MQVDLSTYPPPSQQQLCHPCNVQLLNNRKKVYQKLTIGKVLKSKMATNGEKNNAKSECNVKVELEEKLFEWKIITDSVIVHTRVILLQLPLPKVKPT